MSLEPSPSRPPSADGRPNTRLELQQCTGAHRPQDPSLWPDLRTAPFDPRDRRVLPARPAISRQGAAGPLAMPRYPRPHLKPKCVLSRTDRAPSRHGGLCSRNLLRMQTPWRLRCVCYRTKRTRHSQVPVYLRLLNHLTDPSSCPAVRIYSRAIEVVTGSIAVADRPVSEGIPGRQQLQVSCPGAAADESRKLRPKSMHMPPVFLPLGHSKRLDRHVGASHHRLQAAFGR